MVPNGSNARPELDAATLVSADSARMEDVIAALKARRTVATYKMGDLRVDLDGVGEIRHHGDVALRLRLSRKVGEVTLYREGEAVQSWRNVREVEFSESVTQPTAYVFSVRDGEGRLTTSAIWYEPPAR
jgi:hypothetical protein